MQQFAPKECADLLEAAENLEWVDGKPADGKPADGKPEGEKPADGKPEGEKPVDEKPKGGKLEKIVPFKTAMSSLANATQYASLASFRALSWQGYLEDRFAVLENKNLPSGQAGFLDQIKTEIATMPEKDLGQQSSQMVPFEVTPEAYRILKGTDKDTFIGHQFLESYTEKASLTAVWRLHLLNDNKGNFNDNKEDFYALRMKLQKYFLSPRTIPEVCEFFSAEAGPLQKLFSIDIKVSIFGYRDEFTNDSVELYDKDPSKARHYLTEDALLRNKNRFSITMRPWKDLCVKELILPDNTHAKLIPPVTVAPEEFYVLKVQKAELLLLFLNIYSKDPTSCVKSDHLPQYGKTLDKVLDPSSLDRNTGEMVPEKRILLTELVRDLENALPPDDLETL